MNPTRFSSSAIALSPVRTPDGAPIPDLYSLKASLPNSEESLSFRAIHVPASLLPSLNKASQVSPALLNIESLNFNGRYSQALPGSPRYLLTGVTTDGKLEQNIPLPLKRRARARAESGRWKTASEVTEILYFLAPDPNLVSQAPGAAPVGHPRGSISK